MKILPVISQFNSKRAFYQIGPTFFYTNAGKGTVGVTKKRIIVIKNVEKLGLLTKDIESAKKQRILIKDSDIACVHK